ncbi:MAG: nucleotidyltransferase family protein [Actinomycetota bacterium]|nr:nucleotidyltransferase family protein [Actinomycetota bacterium]
MLAEHRGEILALAERSGVSNIRIFGSVARGDARPGSDIDFLVDLEKGKSLFDLSGFEFELADLLDWDIDVGSEESMKPEMRARALREAVEL